MKKRFSNTQGFTLVELIVVMVIIAILAMIIIPRLSVFQEGAQVSACQANQRVLTSVSALWLSQDPKNHKFENCDIPKLVAAGYLNANDVICPKKGDDLSYWCDKNGIWYCDQATSNTPVRPHSRVTP